MNPVNRLQAVLPNTAKDADVENIRQVFTALFSSQLFTTHLTRLINSLHAKTVQMISRELFKKMKKLHVKRGVR